MNFEPKTHLFKCKVTCQISKLRDLCGGFCLEWTFLKVEAAFVECEYDVDMFKNAKIKQEWKCVQAVTDLNGKLSKNLYKIKNVLVLFSFTQFLDSTKKKNGQIF